MELMVPGGPLETAQELQKYLGEIPNPFQRQVQAEYALATLAKVGDYTGEYLNFSARIAFAMAKDGSGLWTFYDIDLEGLTDGITYFMLGQLVSSLCIDMPEPILSKSENRDVLELRTFVPVFAIDEVA